MQKYTTESRYQAMQKSSKKQRSERTRKFYKPDSVDHKKVVYATTSGF